MAQIKIQPKDLMGQSATKLSYSFTNDDDVSRVDISFQLQDDNDNVLFAGVHSMIDDAANNVSDYSNWNKNIVDGCDWLLEKIGAVKS